MARQVAGDTVVQMYKNCISLEQKLREEMKTKNFYEVDVRTIRQNLRLAYETLLFSDYPGAQVRCSVIVSSATDDCWCTVPTWT